MIARDFLLHDEPISCPMLLKSVTVSVINKTSFKNVSEDLVGTTWGSRGLIRNAKKNVPQIIE